MKSVVLKLIIGLVCLMVSCAAFPVEGWKKTSGTITEEQLQKDTLDCQKTAIEAVGPAPTIGTILWWQERNAAFELCMKSKGYTK